MISDPSVIILPPLLAAGFTAAALPTVWLMAGPVANTRPVVAKAMAVCADVRRLMRLSSEAVSRSKRDREISRVEIGQIRGRFSVAQNRPQPPMLVKLHIEGRSGVPFLVGALDIRVYVRVGPSIIGLAVADERREHELMVGAPPGGEED